MHFALSIGNALDFFFFFFCFNLNILLYHQKKRKWRKLSKTPKCPHFGKGKGKGQNSP